jgi:hypothetical protein
MIMLYRLAVKTFACGLLSLMMFGCQRDPTLVSGNTVERKDLSGEEISRLDKGVLVRFRARLRRPRTEDKCIELFTPDDFSRYNFDGKYAITSTLLVTPESPDLVDGSKEVVVTGKMTFVRDVEDTNHSCGGITGNLFQITEIEDLP